MLLSVFFNKENYEMLDDFLREKKKYIVPMLFIFSAIYIFLLFSSQSYDVRWSGGKFFKGFLDNPHENGYFLLTLIILSLYYISISEWNFNTILVTIFTLYFVTLSFTTGARTPTAASVVLILLFLLNKIKKKSLLLIASIYLVCISIIVYNYSNISFLERIPFFEKVFTQINNEDFLSGREDIGTDIFEYFSDNMNILQKLVGMGLGVSFKINEMLLGVSIWSHNDLLEILVGFGILGVFIYLISIYRFTQRELIPLFIFIFLACFNGLFSYWSFACYSPLLVLIFKNLKRIKK